MKVSVVIPAWRAEHFVGAAIASARAQTLADIEIIVVNDCSPDDTAGAIARAGAGDPRVRAIDLPVNWGPSGAGNRGFEAAQGEWIAVLDADDAMAPDRLERLVSFAEARGLDIAADDLRLVDQDGGAGGTYLGLPGPMLPRAIAWTSVSVFFRRYRSSLCRNSARSSCLLRSVMSFPIPTMPTICPSSSNHGDLVERIMRGPIGVSNASS